jgi:hypothetical protein
MSFRKIALRCGYVTPSAFSRAFARLMGFRILLGLYLMPAAPLLQAAFVPDPGLKPDDYTVLMAVDAVLSEGLTPFQAGGHGKFFVQGWRRPEQQAHWTVSASEPAEYEVSVVVRNNTDQSLRLELSTPGTTLVGSCRGDAAKWWDRVPLAGRLALPAGPSALTLRITPTGGQRAFDVGVHAVELVRPEVEAELTRRALAMRVDPTWFQQARYGIMVHWTSESAPLQGERKPYAEAVAAFDVETFAENVWQTGAGFVVFTTAHAFQYFPAPLAALDRVLPGRTSRRDLVADLAAALGRRGLKLMLYYHLGAVNDPEWVAASGLFDTDTTKLFGNWQAMVSEVGERYGDRLAGWWFDEGSTGYYHRSAPWESLARAAKAGHPQRLVGFNAWELANPTQFHDFCTGEGCQEPRGFCGLLTPGGDGRYPSGTHVGLQASACLITERDWGHFGLNTPLSEPKWSADQLAALLEGFIACRNVPLFNLEITQDGHLSAKSISLFRQAAAALP